MRGNATRTQLLAAAKFGQIDDESATDDLAAQTLHKLDPRLGGAARGQKIINQQHLFPRCHSVVMHLHHRLAIFQRIGFGNGGGGQLAFFADGHEAAL